MSFESKPSLKSQAGFTLSGVMIALGVVSVLGLIIAGFSSTASKMFSDVEKSNAVTETFTELRFSLSKSRICNANLKGKTFSVNSATPTPVQVIKSFGANNIEAGKIIELNQIIRGLKVKELQLATTQVLSESLVLADLQATFEKDTTNEADKGLTLKRSLPMLLRVQGNVIQECWAKKPVPEGSYSSICTTTTDGALNDTDENGNCVLANGVWITGGTMSATCPDRAFLPDAADERYNCRPIIPPGFEDNFPKTSVAMTNGQSIPQGRAFYIMSLNKETKTCQCNWATDIPSGTLSNFRCQILCLVP